MRVSNILVRFGAAVVLAATVVSLSGCKFLSLFMEREPDSAVAEITQMPQVTFSDLDKTGRKLTSAGMNVVVRREELIVNPKGERGHQPFTVPEALRPFRPGEWNHMVAAQDPPADAPLHPGATVTLTAGIHHGAGPFRPWLAAHATSVKIRGEQRCRDCHAPERCSECHAKAGVAAGP